jgi:hypothetical protein
MIDRTKEWAPKIAQFLRTDEILKKLRVRSLSRLTRTYDGWDYRHAGGIIGRGKIEIYEVAGTAFVGRYSRDARHDHFEFDRDDLPDGPLAMAGVVVHEVTHMIQDFKRMKLSKIEWEMDAYFVEAVYLARIKKLEGYPRLADFPTLKDVAEKVAENDGLMLKRDFSDQRDAIRQEVGSQLVIEEQGYLFLGGDIDGEDADKTGERLDERHRMDGVRR